ncbi:hypothetical protein DRP53_00535 [candidate division WOR-3 bacterium]|uniref:Uncharacterized protein n=1 Tax=candidate division WOR-3 bacterium TaxID=2052148 RepID=A0A660SLI5_UNCW3|nr:MAG: hypothetical protein DRP53_00535 [candidate division WOR-3 bacterium]
MINRVVARYLNGRTIRGYTTDFRPDAEVFHLVAKEKGEDKSYTIVLDELKAVFFVKQLEGMDPRRPVVKRDFDEVKDKRLVGKKVKVVFKDGEELRGTTLGYSPKRKGFFFTPIDPESNNERIFAILSAVKDITFYD